MIVDQWESVADAEWRAAYCRKPVDVYRHLMPDAAAVPARPVVFTEQGRQELTRVALDIREAVRTFVMDRWTTAGQLAAALGTDVGDLPLTDPDEPITAAAFEVLRPDVILERGTARLLELNVDGSVGGTRQVDQLGAEFSAAAARSGVVLREDPGNVPARFALIGDGLKASGAAGRHIVFPHFPEGIVPHMRPWEGFASWTEAMSPQAEELGLSCAPFPLSGLTLGDTGRLLAGGREVDAVVRLFTTADQPAGPGLEALKTAVLGRRVLLHTSEIGELVSNKRLLAWMWDAVRKDDPSWGEVVRRHVPESVDLDPAAGDAAALLARACGEQDSWVLKPAGGYGGQGVVVGADTDPGTWRRALDACLVPDGGQSAVLQRRVTDDGLTMTFTDGSSRPVTLRVPVVYGPFVFGQNAGGVLVRHGSEPGPGVVNIQRGACWNTVLTVG
ncbi:hypothetical protein OG338_03025 [Streptomyces sp. NBC_00726]|uniref:hypothetical protein n=1 Tax=Streptomyces sp. NBC_00726 TaxID=2903674 RepID=UPI0038701495